MTDMIKVTEGILEVAKNMNKADADVFLHAALSGLTRTAPAKAQPKAAPRKAKRTAKADAKPKRTTLAKGKSYADGHWFSADELFSLYKEKYADRFPWKQVKSMAMKAECNSADDLNAILDAIPEGKDGKKIANAMA